MKNNTHLLDCALAAIEIKNIMDQVRKLKEELNFPFWELRIGMHTGFMTAGVIHGDKISYDLWRKDVELTTQIEASGKKGKINISDPLYQKIKNFFDCEFNKNLEISEGEFIDTYFLNSILPEYSVGGEGKIPNDSFLKFYKDLKQFG